MLVKQIDFTVFVVQHYFLIIYLLLMFKGDRNIQNDVQPIEYDKIL